MTRFSRAEKAFRMLLDCVYPCKTKWSRNIMVPCHLGQSGEEHAYEGRPSFCQFFSILIAALKSQHTATQRWLLFAKFLDLVWETYHLVYPKENCPFEGGFEESLKKLFKLNEND